MERGWRWCKHNRMLAGLMVSSGFLLIAVAVVSTLWAVVSEEAKRSAEASRQEVESAALRFRYGGGDGRMETERHFAY